MTITAFLLSDLLTAMDCLMKPSLPQDRSIFLKLAVRRFHYGRGGGRIHWS